MDPILDGLNGAQHTAVTSPADVLQILAPPGSGKTKTLTSRVAYLLQHHGYKPWNVLCLTFTIKSAREMKERITKLIGNGSGARLVLGTFHSVCRRYLVAYGHLIGIRKGFGIADSSDTASIIKRIIKRLQFSIEPKVAQSRISRKKSKGLRSMDSSQRGAAKKSVDQQEFELVFEAYETHLEKSNLLDYDDLLLRCVDLLTQHPECVSNVEAVLIDEFQDTNYVQFELMKSFATKHKRVTTVGDPDQSIYGWRSAEIANLMKMRAEYPDTLAINLEDNYRSSGAILLAAQEVIEQDVSRFKRPLLPTHCPGSRPVLRKLPSAEVEAAWIVREIQRIVGATANLLRNEDVAILLRSASLSRPIESAMGTAGIPYRVVGGQKFYDRVEIKILLDYMRVFSQPGNNDALSRIINVPSRKIGTTTTKTLLEEAELKKVTLWSLVRDIAQGNTTPRTKITKPAEQSLKSFVGLIITSKEKLKHATKAWSPAALLDHVAREIDFQEHLKRTYEHDHETRWENVEELVAQATEYSIDANKLSEENEDDERLPAIDGLEQQFTNAAEEALSRFLANVALATESQRQEEEGSTSQSQITLSTIHAAKGLEWPVVFIPSAYEGSIPHSRAEDADEERRLLNAAQAYRIPDDTTLSHFLAPKEVQRLLAVQGPRFSSTTVMDIARILSRQPPSIADLERSWMRMENMKDDLWPLNGQSRPEDARRQWHTNTGDSSNDVVEPAHKRRKANTNREWQGDHNSDRSAWTTATSISTTTTMQNSASFSYHGSAGFVSAAHQMQQSRAEHPLRQQNSEAERRSKSTIRKKDSLKKACEVEEQQGGLLNFWQPKSQPVADLRNGVSLVSKPRATRELRNEERGEEVIKHCEPSQLPETTTDSTTPHLPTYDPPTALPRKPLSTIPQTLSSHKLKPLKPTTRPPSLIPDPEQNHKPHVFLSSSPFPIKTTTAFEQQDEQATVEEGEVKLMEETRPANTYHNTSMAQVQAALAAPKRTLGVRRSMVGWSARQGSGFSVPSRKG